MINPPPPKETNSQHYPSTKPPFSSTNLTKESEADEMTYADINRQLALIVNILVSIIACSIAIWIIARHQQIYLRLGLSMGGSGLVAVAEIVIYAGYIRRISEAKELERESGKMETKEVVETWVIEADEKKGMRKSMRRDGKEGPRLTMIGDGQDEGKLEGVRYRKGRHR